MEFYLDANGTDGTDNSKIDRVYEDGTRIPLNAPKVQITDWDGLINAMLASPAFGRITSTSMDRDAVWLLIASVTARPKTSGQFLRLRLFWNRTLASLAEPISLSEIEELNSISSTYNAPFSFKEDGNLS